MTPDEFMETLRGEEETALSRLGSSKSLYADTEGEMEPETVLAAAATAEHHAAETFAAWADDEAVERAREAWAETAAEEREHYEAIVERLDDHEPGAAPAIQTYLRDLDDTVERIGGFLGRTLAADRSKGQATGFFTGQADPQTAGLFRDLRDDLDGQIERGRSLLAARCEDEDDWDRALTAAEGAIEAAYEEYTEQLESMGVNPKPVC